MERDLLLQEHAREIARRTAWARLRRSGRARLMNRLAIPARDGTLLVPTVLLYGKSFPLVLAGGRSLGCPVSSSKESAAEIGELSA